MKRLIIGVISMGIISMLTGCSKPPTGGTDASKPISEESTSESQISKDPITIDYAEYPEDFMIKLVAGQKYVLKNGETLIDFCANSISTEKSEQILEYGECKADISGAVYYGETVPVLIHYNDKDYVWICEQSENNDLLSASVYYVTQNNSMGNDSCILNIKMGDDILDPNDFTITNMANCFGTVMYESHYRVGNTGKPEEIETDDKYYGIEESYMKEQLRLDNDIHTWVYANADTQGHSVQDIPAGTTFYRLRIPKDEEYCFSEGILEDGRVFRIIEEEKFSEPSSYWVTVDMDGHKFGYSVVSD